jgi:type III secretion protein J
MPPARTRPPTAARARRARLAALAALALALAGCGEEAILHGLDEPSANEVLVALDEGGVSARKRREDGAEGGFTVEVPASEVGRAQRLLAARELPRPRAPGFGEVFGKGGMVPTPTEEHALYLHALGGELARSVEAIDGVVEARVHLGLPQADPLRRDPARPRAAVLVKCRPRACANVRGLEAGIRALVAGSADGLEPGAVSVVIAEAADVEAAPAAAGRARSPWLLGAAALAALSAAGILAYGVAGRLRRERTA